MAKRLAAVVLALSLIAVASPASTAKGKAKKPKPYEETGHVILPGAPITWYEFAFNSCPGAAASQGISGYVFQLPNEMWNRDDLVILATTNSPTGTLGGLSLVFFDFSCGSLGTEVPTGPVAVPPGTVYIQAHDFFSANYDVTIKVSVYK